MENVFAYTRVSTARQGTQGSSLAEQKAAIERYASTNQLIVIHWFEEQETAAKRGRPVFSQMLTLLDRGKATGVIIHKIDRSARNLKDWADLGELVDRGIKIHLAHESLDMTSRGGRLAADIQAVVAADYIRNLRQEIQKGIIGRLKQGLWPWPAPPGYLDNGGGKPKTIDPYRGPMVRRLFELYATGNYSLRTLAEEARLMGLRGRDDSRLSRNGLSTILNNEFYTSVLLHKRTGEKYAGLHEPLISPRLFQQVRTVLSDKHIKKTVKQSVAYRQFVRCSQCRRFLIGERQKGRVYYRCHTPNCRGVGLREDRLSECYSGMLKKLIIPEDMFAALQEELNELVLKHGGAAHSQKANTQLVLDRTIHRLNTLTDRYLDGDIDRDIYLTKKAALVTEQATLHERLREMGTGKDPLGMKVEQFVELQRELNQRPNPANADEMRRVVQTVGLNFLMDGKKPHVDWRNDFVTLQEFCIVSGCGPERTSLRTFRDVRTVAQCIFDIWQSEMNTHQNF